MQQKQEDLLLTIVIATLFFLLIGIFYLLLVFMFYQKQRKNKLEREAMKQQFKQTILKTQIEIQENTLNYISGEIHDNIGQVLSLIRINLNILAEANPSENLNKIDSLLGNAIRDLRHLSHNLNSSHLLDLGIIEALNQLLLQIEKTGKFKTELIANQSILNFISNDNSLILYRMIQELLNNIIKHANATHIIISIKMIDPKICLLTVSDDGKGFDISAVLNQKKGIGLRHIFSRAKMINASVTIQSKEPTGTNIFIEIKK
jgi:signal transduction histidine kinase